MVSFPWINKMLSLRVRMTRKSLNPPSPVQITVQITGGSYEVTYRKAQLRVEEDFKVVAFEMLEGWDEEGVISHGSWCGNRRTMRGRRRGLCFHNWGVPHYPIQPAGQCPGLHVQAIGGGTGGGVNKLISLIWVLKGLYNV